MRTQPSSYFIKSFILLNLISRASFYDRSSSILTPIQIMKFKKHLLILTSLPIAIKGNQHVQTSRNELSNCPCATKERLLFFTFNNTDHVTSCKNKINDIGIWYNMSNNSKSGGWHAFGFHVYDELDSELRPSCLMEGDIMMKIDIDEAKYCREMITQRCIDIGLLLGDPA